MKTQAIPQVTLTPDMLDPELIRKIPQEVLVQCRMIPLSLEGDVLTLAMADPLDVSSEDVVRMATGCRIVRVQASPEAILAALEGNLGTPDEAAAREAAPIVQMVNSLLSDAIRMGASDIHIEPQKDLLRVRYRIDGYLRTIVELPKWVQLACISRLKIISGLDISESRKPQDGRTRVRMEGREIDLRVSSLPAFHGEKLVLRVLDSDAVVVSLEKLGFSDTDYQKFMQVLSSSQGMILCTGPTGSGKTSTLYSSLLHLNEDSDNLVTVEDPVEYQLPGINQVQVHNRAGLTFSAALRSILRQDPDAVLIGEIRDLETAEIALQAAQTGHLVLSTLHTNDAVATLSRLVMMGVQPYLLASSLLAVIAQRLVRRLCPHCRRPAQISEKARNLLALAGIRELPQNVYEAEGCEHCNHAGYKGRLGLFEFLQVSDRLRERMLSGANEAELTRIAREEGMLSLLEDGLRKCGDGLTSIEEVLRVVTVRPEGGRVCPGCHCMGELEHPICVYCGYEIERNCTNCAKPVKKEWCFCPSCRSNL